MTGGASEAGTPVVAGRTEMNTRCEFATTPLDSAVVTLTMAGTERTVTLRTGLANEETMPPYAVRLLYTGVNESATLEVAKFRQ